MADIIEEADEENQDESSRNLISRRYSSYSSSSSESIPPFSFRNLPRRKKLILLTLCISDFAANISESIITPFFPIEARNRGVSNTVSGWIFGVLPLTQFLVSPLAGLAIQSVGSKFTFIAGVFVNGGGSLLFGFLTHIPTADGGIMFTIYCFVLRIFMALGIASYTTAGFCIMAYEFEDYVSIIFGILETFCGLGMVVGPAIGGLLYGLGGFTLPFLVLGIFMLSVIPVCYRLLPVDDARQLPAVPVSGLLRVPEILVIGFSVTILSTVWSSLDPTVQPRLAQFSLSPVILGLVFLLLAASYAITSPIIGWLCEKIENPAWLTVLGLLLTAGALIMFGPSPLVQPDKDFNSLPLNLASMVLIGVSFGIGLVPTYECVLDAADDAGFVDNMALYGAVGGLWGSFFALGEFIGPVLGGLLLDHTSFQWCMTTMAGLCLFVLCLLLPFLLYQRRVEERRRKDRRAEALLRNLIAESRVQNAPRPRNRMTSYTGRGTTSAYRVHINERSSLLTNPGTSSRVEIHPNNCDSSRNLSRSL